MNAPRVWPNSSASASSGVSAAQLKRTKARSARRDAWTIASATRSLPVPLSPVRRTVTSRGATRATSTASRRIGSEEKTMVRASASSPASRSFSCASRTASSARRTTASSSSVSNGFLK